MKLQRKQKSRGPTKGKTFSDYRERHQSRVRKQTVKDCETLLSFLGLQNFVATKIEIFNENTNKYETLTLVDEENIQTSSPTEELTDEDIDEINLLLDTKERFNISNEAYHELTMIGKHLTRSWKIQDRIKEMNRKWNLYPTPSNTNRVQQRMKERLEIRLQTLIKNTPSYAAFKLDRKLE